MGGLIVIFVLGFIVGCAVTAWLMEPEGSANRESIEMRQAFKDVHDRLH